MVRWITLKVKLTLIARQKLKANPNGKPKE
jgi:hypothetical protein